MPRPYDTIKTAVRSGVGVSRFRITREQAEEIKRVQKEEGHQAATLALLRMLWPKG